MSINTLSAIFTLFTHSRAVLMQKVDQLVARLHDLRLASSDYEYQMASLEDEEHGYTEPHSESPRNGLDYESDRAELNKEWNNYYDDVCMWDIEWDRKFDALLKKQEEIDMQIINTQKEMNEYLAKIPMAS